MLMLKNISKSFGEKSVLDDFSYEFQPNKIYKLSGHNGSGKTTLLRIISGSIIPDNGEIISQNKEKGPPKITLIESNSRSFIQRLSVKENLFYFSALNGNFVNDRGCLETLSFWDSEDLVDKNMSELSSGQIQIISLIRGLLEKPSVLLLDECMSNLDAIKAEKVTNYIENFVEKNEHLVISCNHSELTQYKIEREICL